MIKTVSFYIFLCLFLVGCATAKKDTKTLTSPFVGGNKLIVSPNFDFTRLKKIAVIPFSNSGKPGTDPEAAEKFSLLCMELGFIVVERSQIDKVFKEMELEMAGALDGANLEKAGKLLSVDMLVTGNLSYEYLKGTSMVRSKNEDPSAGELSIISENIKFINSSTGEILISAFCDSPAPGTESLIETAARMLSTKISPLLK